MSAERERKIPGPDHPIDVLPFAGRVVVRVGDKVIVDTENALELRESTYPAAMYVPIADLDQAVLLASATETYCPYKGEASYYSLATDAGTIDDAVWYYAEPYPAVDTIAGHAAFYPNKVEISVEPAA